MEGIFAAAQERLQTAERWIKEPIQVKPPELVIEFDGKSPKDRPIISRIRVRTYRDIPLDVTSSDKNVVARVISLNGWDEKPKAQNGRESEMEIVLEIAPEALREGLKATLVVGSPQLEYQTQIKIESKQP